MPGAFGWPHLLIILAIVVLLFGATKLPTLAKSLGQSARAFKGEMKAMKEDDAKDVPAEADAAASTTTVRSEAAPNTGNGSGTTTPSA